ncbi:hypothetical protein G5C60_11885 [Streptomyces sp. HC44]|uniref:Uncharacterized protein n=1 Tax=Streptomyces scabichelini TaxID=2711217 RepID=A0A6G4V2L5_9ACTN|nr:hypothetical protein [Streptomyces scabichelini]NGO08308.1 hypothetical protein [Streptomyces scabichelini]
MATGAQQARTGFCTAVAAGSAGVSATTAQVVSVNVRGQGDDGFGADGLPREGVLLVVVLVVLVAGRVGAGQGAEQDRVS